MSTWYRIPELTGPPLDEVHKERLREMYDWLTKQHELKEAGLSNEWHQPQWIMKTGDVEPNCGTVCCVFGHVAMDVLGMEPVFDRGFAPEDWPTATIYVKSNNDSRLLTVSDVARRYLGLNEQDGSVLSVSTNTYEDITAILTKWGVLS